MAAEPVAETMASINAETVQNMIDAAMAIWVSKFEDMHVEIKNNMAVVIENVRTFQDIYIMPHDYKWRTW